MRSHIGKKVIAFGDFNPVLGHSSVVDVAQLNSPVAMSDHHNIADINSLAGGWTAPNGSTEADYLGDGQMYMYFTNGVIDLYVHADVADVT